MIDKFGDLCFLLFCNKRVTFSHFCASQSSLSLFAALRKDQKALTSRERGLLGQISVVDFNAKERKKYSINTFNIITMLMTKLTLDTRRAPLHDKGYISQCERLSLALFIIRGLGGVFVELNLRLEYEWIRYVCGRV